MHTAMQAKMNGLINGYDEKCSPQNCLHNVLQSSEKDYIKCIRSSLKGHKVFLKQKRCDIKVNAYNRILHTWTANIDIQFVVNPYACAMYIVTYVRGVRDLLNRAA